jgi:Fungal Zn(2)-Cys(6) binuclear cluster domain
MQVSLVDIQLMTSLVANGSRIRRVKCDEMKPACNRCTSTGRKCEGYPVLTPAPSRGNSRSPSTQNLNHSSDSLYSLSIYRLSSEIPGDEAERRSFYYLRERAIYDISGYFELEFWDRLVLQISHAEPTVRHALLALSSLCETYESKSIDQNLAHDRDILRVQFALQQYNKAVRLLAEYLSTSQTRLEVILTSCLIFVWLEFMRNDFDAGLKHLKSGLQILDDFHRPATAEACKSQHIDTSLIHLFGRLHIQATVHGSPTFGFTSERQFGKGEICAIVPTSFQSIEQARSCLYTLLDTIFRFIRQIDSDFIISRTESQSWPDALILEATCNSHLNLLREWQESIKNSQFRSLNSRQTAAMSLLYLYHKLVSILLEALFTHSQMIYDQYGASFEQVLTLAEQLIHNSQNMRLIIFFDMGVMAPLFYVILKCRNLALRRKALSLLRVSPYREGMWHRPDVIQYAEWKIDIEERGRGQLSETEPLPEEARIWNERMEDVVIDGRPRTLIRFQRRRNGHLEYGEDVTDLNMGMGKLL